MSRQLEQGRHSYQRRAWRDAYEPYICADQTTPLEIDDLERLTTCAYLIGQDVEFTRMLDRLHRLHLRAGDPERAARSAFWLGLSLLFRGHAGQADAWIARVQRLIEGRDCVERGYLLVPVAEQQLRIDAVHDNVPRGVAPADNLTGWQQSLDALAALVEPGE